MELKSWDCFSRFGRLGFWWILILLRTVWYRHPTYLFVVDASQLPSMLPPCMRYQDTHGVWVNHSLLPRSEITSHFHDRNVAQAGDFDLVWLPHNCSYRRFDNVTVAKAAALQLLRFRAEMKGRRVSFNETAPLNIIMFGDSALRGIFCGIARIMAGSETIGPCMNAICGRSKQEREISIPRIHRRRDVQLTPDLTIGFYYVKSFHIKHLDWLLEWSLEHENPFAVVLNTGAWDYYDYSKAHKDEEASLRCHNNATAAIAARRADSFVNQTLRSLSQEAESRSIRLIYRNNHVNRRFGALCADEAFESLLLETKWELWDNRRMSETVWRSQCHDGFHFDWPVLTFTEEEHAAYNSKHRALFGQHPGMLAQQLAQSLLNALFFDVLTEV